MKKIIVTVFALLPSFAFAHPGHTDGFVAAFAHPFTGIDHLLMMLCVGIFAGRIGGKARWQLPLTFLAMMTTGWTIAAAGYSFAGIETGIAAGLIALGVLFCLHIDAARMLQVSVIAAFALLHGMAHGAELSNASPLATTMGFLVATALLHGAGLLIAALLPREKQNLDRAIGVVLAIVGGGLLAAV